MWLQWPADWLVINERPVQSDVIVVPSGQVHARIPKAAELIHQGYAQALFVTAGGDLDQTFLLMGMRVTDRDVLVRLIARERIPPEMVTMGPHVPSTFADAVVFRDYARAHHTQSAILVTSHLHARRARWTYRRVLAGLPVRLITVDAPQSDFPVDHWWRNEDGLLNVINEYLKIGFYVTHF